MLEAISISITLAGIALMFAVYNSIRNEQVIKENNKAHEELRNLIGKFVERHCQ